MTIYFMISDSMSLQQNWKSLQMQQTVCSLKTTISHQRHITTCSFKTTISFQRLNTTCSFTTTTLNQRLITMCTFTTTISNQRHEYYQVKLALIGNDINTADRSSIKRTKGDTVPALLHGAMTSSRRDKYWITVLREGHWTPSNYK